MNDEKPFDWTGLALPTIIVAVGFGMAYWVWPDGVLDKPLASLTLRDVFSVIPSILLALFGASGIAAAIKKYQ